MRRVLVIGATGNVGRPVLSLLPANGVRVRALVRNPQTAGLPSHVEAVRGDLTQAETLDECLDGIDTVFLVWCAPAAAAPAALDRIARHTRRIVFLSSPYKTAHPFFQGGQPNPAAALHAEIERLIETSGCEWTFLRPGLFALNCRNWWVPQMRRGNVIRWPYAAAQVAPIDERDIARAAVRALCEEGHAGAEYVLTGPQSLTQLEQVATLGDVTGRALRMEEISPDEARAELATVLPGFSLNMLMGAWAASIGMPALVTSTVAEITGAPARTFRQWAVDHAAEFRT